MKNKFLRPLSLLTLLFAAFMISGCSSAYYSVMESLGEPKRDILVNRVEKAQKEQQEAKVQFENALEEFMSVLTVDGGELESQYRTLNREFERSESQANEVSDRIDKIESVATALFKEWEGELSEYTNAALRQSSQQTLNNTRRLYDELIMTMRDAEARMEPVLGAFRDQVLFLKHNLNAQAIASIQSEVGVLEGEVQRLIEEMNKSIEAADVFLNEIGKAPK